MNPAHVITHTRKSSTFSGDVKNLRTPKPTIPTGDADEALARLPAPYAVRMSTRRELTPAEREAYDRDGFVRTPTVDEQHVYA